MSASKGISADIVSDFQYFYCWEFDFVIASMETSLP